MGDHRDRAQPQELRPHHGHHCAGADGGIHLRGVGSYTLRGRQPPDGVERHSEQPGGGRRGVPVPGIGAGVERVLRLRGHRPVRRHREWRRQCGGRRRQGLRLHWPWRGILLDLPGLAAHGPVDGRGGGGGLVVPAFVGHVLVLLGIPFGLLPPINVIVVRVDLPRLPPRGSGAGPASGGRELPPEPRRDGPHVPPRVPELLPGVRRGVRRPSRRGVSPLGLHVRGNVWIWLRRGGTEGVGAVPEEGLGYHSLG
mmetsp:Transcript_32033/g.95966  ORF Transcript_32033/g.95966 Transcript_32033/m.95966 type:complete len:254 (+) Transcript_32033:356-1117(+)